MFLGVFASPTKRSANVFALPIDAIIMAIECTAANLVQLSKCLDGLTPTQQKSAQLYLLCQLASPGICSPGGNNMEIQFNDNGAFNGSPDLTWDGSTLSASNIVVPNNINSSERKLIDENGYVSVNWATWELSVEDVLKIDWSDGVLTDGNSVDSVKWDQRRLTNVDGVILNWQTNVAIFPIGLTQHQTIFTVGGDLPAAGNAGTRAFVSNALNPIFGSVVAAGGGVTVPVYDDGVAWRVG